MESRQFFNPSRRADRTITKEPTSSQINFLWIGKPTKINPEAIAGHDVAGPITLAKALEEQHPGTSSSKRIIFWCLAEHKDFFVKQFKDMNVDIAVQAIEELIKKEEIAGEFVTETAFVKDRLADLKLHMDDTEARVAFKDLFSIYILLIVSGYFIDTNVFRIKDIYPEKNSIIKLNGERAAATDRNPDGRHDFYFMYSPFRGDAQIQKVFRYWLTQPSIGINFLDAFDEHVSGAKIGYLTIEKIGLWKLSFKSYNREKLAENSGLFFWRFLNADELKEKLPYGDVNQQFASPRSVKFIKDCWLELRRIRRGDMPDSKTLLVSLPAGVNQAYIAVKDYRGREASDESKIYYVNKDKEICKCIYDEEEAGIFADFHPSRMATNVDLISIAGVLKIPAEFQPEHMINIDGDTLLHDAVLKGDIKKINYLLEAGARLDLKARFQHMPSKEIFEFTPMELAKHMKNEEIVKLMEKIIEKEMHETRVSSSARK